MSPGAIQDLFKGLNFECFGKPIFLFKGGFVGGIQFKKVTPDQSKEIGDFMERLSGHGYV